MKFIKYLVKCTLGFHHYKTIGFWRDYPEGEYEICCEFCRKSKWTNYPINGLIKKLIEKDNNGDFYK